jgi:hypothetical protein
MSTSRKSLEKASLEKAAFEKAAERLYSAAYLAPFCPREQGLGNLSIR